MPTVEKINRVHNLRSRLKKRPADVSLQDIADRYDISWHWLKDFHMGRHSNPHSRLLDKLEAALTDIASKNA